MSKRRQALFQKQWNVVLEIQRHARGITRQRLLEATGIPPTTLHRLIQELRNMGLPIDVVTRNGEALYTLEALVFPPLAPTASQLLALRFVRRMCTSIEGSHITRELDALLSPHSSRETERDFLSLRPSVPNAPNVLGVLDRAIEQRRRVRIRVFTRGNVEAHDRTLDPLCLRHVGGDVYLGAFDLARRDYRTFKIARVSHAQKLTELADEHPDFDEERHFAHAVKIGGGAPIEVRVRFAPQIAKLVREYPLVPSQALEDERDGSTTLIATVAGLDEVKRRVLAWGRDAEVLAPEALRQAIAEELEAAAAKYRRAGRSPGVARAGRARGDRVVPRIVDRG